MRQMRRMRSLLVEIRAILVVAGTLCAVLPGSAFAVIESSGSHFEEAEDFPLMGDWQGAWIDAKRGVEAHDPGIAAQLIPEEEGVYQLQILPRLYIRAAPYLVTTVREEGGRIDLDAHGWRGTMQDGVFTGSASLHGDRVAFEMKKVRLESPTLGLEAPPGATVLFDGADFEHWEHHDERDVTWVILEDGAMEVVSGFWNKDRNRADGRGGDIRTKRAFHDLRLHMEFRYPVELGKRGQGRGNSGLFFHGIGEVQILNSYGLHGYWDEGGAFYRILPPNINAAGPPLEWQTYDVELALPRYDENTGQKRSDAVVTVYHNGRLIHHRAVVPTGHRGAVRIGLQDHINPIQFRNIWIQEF